MRHDGCLQDKQAAATYVDMALKATLGGVTENYVLRHDRVKLGRKYLSVRYSDCNETW